MQPSVAINRVAGGVGGVLRRMNVLRLVGGELVGMDAAQGCNVAF